jgi:membrane associated rhomboid family serine protease
LIGAIMFPLRVSVPTRFPPAVTYALIAINSIVFLFQESLPEPSQLALTYTYGLVPARYTHPEWALSVGLSSWDFLPFVTNTFMHGGWLHLILNMWTLWLFGPAVEDRLGSTRYLLFYLVCGVAASAAHAWMNAESTVPALGASGAIAGVLGAYMRLFPFSNVLILIPIIFIPFFFPLPAFIYIALWFIMQVIQGLGSTLVPQAGGIAWWAHIGGFLAGMLLVPLLCCAPRTYRDYYGDEGVMGFRTRGER